MMMVTRSEDGTPWRKLQRKVRHRTSIPTNALVRHFVLAFAGPDGSGEPTADAVIFAALRLADANATSREALRREVRRIEAERYA